MKSVIRKLAVTGGAAAVLLAAGGATATVTAHAAGETAVHCAVKGTATITPGLGAPPGSAQSFSYSGSASCHGVIDGVAINDGAGFNGTISGSGSCPSGNLVSCIGVLPPISASLADGGQTISASGSYVQAGGDITVEASGTDTGGGAVTVEANAVFTPSGTAIPVSSVTFTGSATAHTS